MQKYSTELNFFMAKPIIEITYNQSKTNTALNYKEVIAFALENEYLKRFYQLKNAIGKN
jgi:hypothetical protein